MKKIKNEKIGCFTTYSATHCVRILRGGAIVSYDYHCDAKFGKIRHTPIARAHNNIIYTCATRVLAAVGFRPGTSGIILLSRRRAQVLFRSFSRRNRRALARVADEKQQTDGNNNRTAVVSTRS